VSGASVEEGGAGGEDPVVVSGNGGQGSGATGGRSEGGRGGASSGGASAGQGGRPPFSLPAGCDTIDESGDATSCFLDFVCGSQPLDAVACGALTSDRWKCTCGVAVEGATFELEGASGADVCVVAAGLCNADDLDVGDETCGEVYDDGTLDSCSLTLSCGKPVVAAFPPGVAVWQTSYPNGHCQRDGEGLPFNCSCSLSLGGTYTDYGLVAESGTAACGPLLDFCRSGDSPVFDGDTMCVDAYPMSNADSCSLAQACATPMRLTEEVSLARVDLRNSNCTSMSLGGSNCFCARPAPDPLATEVFRFEIQATPGADSCASAVLNCDQDAVITSLGPASCQSELGAQGANSCGSYFNCRQPASVDGREVVALGALIVNCERLASGGPWACGCASGPEATVFDLGASDLDPSEACEAAPVGCLERMSVHLGPYVDDVSAPDPLPDVAHLDAL
jgi:hypothetical protein